MTAAEATTTAPTESGRTLALGVSQIFLQENWIAGLTMLMGFALYSVPMALLVALGALVATASAAAVRLPTAHGLQGYCGALVGAAAWTTFGQLWPAVLLCVLGAAACPAVTEGLALLFGLVARAGGPLPVLTAPFCIVSGLGAWLAQAVAPAPPAGASPAVTGNPALQLGEAVLTGIGQVVFAQSWLSGAVVLAALFLCGWRVGVAAFGGSLLGTLTAWASGQPLAELAAGLAGYSPCLTAIALGAVFLRPGVLAWVLAGAGAVVTVGAQALLALTPVPVYTWPFIVVTWLALLLFDGSRR